MTSTIHIVYKQLLFSIAATCVNTRYITIDNTKILIDKCNVLMAKDRDFLLGTAFYSKHGALLYLQDVNFEDQKLMHWRYKRFLSLTEFLDQI